MEIRKEKARSLVKLCTFNNAVCIICIQKDGGGETVSDCMALTSSPESARVLQFAAKYHMFSYLVGIKIYIVVRVTWSVSESVTSSTPLPSPAGHEERPSLKIAHSYWNLPSHNYKFFKIYITRTCPLYPYPQASRSDRAAGPQLAADAAAGLRQAYCEAEYSHFH